MTPMQPDDPHAAGWTINTLRVYLESRLNAMKEASVKANEAAAEAIDKAENATRLRFESVNEFRKTLTDQASQFATRAQFEEAQKASQSSREAVNQRLEALSTRIDRGETAGTVRREDSVTSRNRFEWNTGTTLSAILSLLAILAVVLEAILNHH